MLESQITDLNLRIRKFDLIINAICYAMHDPEGANFTILLEERWSQVNIHAVTRENQLNPSIFLFIECEIKYERWKVMFISSVKHYFVLVLGELGLRERGMTWRGVSFTEPLLVTALREEGTRGILGRSSPLLLDPLLVCPELQVELESPGPWLPLLVVAFSSPPCTGITSKPCMPAMLNSILPFWN